MEGAAIKMSMTTPTNAFRMANTSHEELRAYRGEHEFLVISRHCQHI
jgi:hypothetical protein